MTAPDWFALAKELCVPPMTRASGDLDDEQAWRELAAYRAYQRGDDAGPSAVELPPIDADVRYTGTWRGYLGNGDDA